MSLCDIEIYVLEDISNDKHDGPTSTYIWWHTGRAMADAKLREHEDKKWATLSPVLTRDYGWLIEHYEPIPYCAAANYWRRRQRTLTNEIRHRLSDVPPPPPQNQKLRKGYG